ncbi:MAG TPA: hypothetical protein VFE62_20950 [Gemmataceae bacterium]|nr:hypothetical protein [Gemmataceae bacterium]
MKFYVGLHMPSHAAQFERCMISVARLRDRKSDFEVGEWMMDSGAFTEIKTHGRYRDSVEQYAAHAERWSRCGQCVAVVSQDYMCEPFILAKTGLTTQEHQRLTIERYDALSALVRSAYVLPVLQGYLPDEYVAHAREYGERLAHGQWVGVGSVCKRNVDVEEIEAVLMAIRREAARLEAARLRRQADGAGIVRGKGLSLLGGFDGVELLGSQAGKGWQ